MSFRIYSKNVMNVAFLSNKIKKNIYSDPKNEHIMKILWYFVLFLDFFFNIIKLGEPKFIILQQILCGKEFLMDKKMISVVSLV